jgi:hypothetical protein
MSVDLYVPLLGGPASTGTLTKTERRITITAFILLLLTSSIKLLNTASNTDAGGFQSHCE